jgi:Ca2+-binding RTX toxin-like protein
MSTTYNGFTEFFGNKNSSLLFYETAASDPNANDSVTFGEATKVGNVHGDYMTLSGTGAAETVKLTVQHETPTASTDPTDLLVKTDRTELASLRYMEADKTFTYSFKITYDGTQKDTDADGTPDTDVSASTPIGTADWLSLAQLHQDQVNATVSGLQPIVKIAATNSGRIQIAVASNEQNRVLQYSVISGVGALEKGAEYDVTMKFKFDGDSANDTLFNIDVNKNGSDLLELMNSNITAGGGLSSTVLSVGTVNGVIDETVQVSGTTDASELNTFHLGNYDPSKGPEEKLVSHFPYLRIGPYRSKVDDAESTSMTYSNFKVTAHDDISKSLTGNGELDLAGKSFNESDTLTGGTGNDTLVGNGPDTLIGGTGNDTYKINDAATAVVENYNEGIDTLKGYGGNDNLKGGDGGDRLYGGNGYDSLRGEAGNDWLDGGAGNDWIYLGAGSNTVKGGSGSDYISFAERGSGPDLTIDLSAGTTALSSAPATVVDTLDSIENVTGSSAKDHITGTDSVNRLRGLYGNDTLLGMGGNDTLDGGKSNDSLEGGGGNDILNGEEGNDTLDGGYSNDTLTGGTGNDVFVFAKGAGQDVITDLNVAEDTIRFEGFGGQTYTPTSTAGGTAVFDFGADGMLTVDYTGSWNSSVFEFV